LGLGERGVLVGITTALTESTLINVNFGDMQNGTMTSSRGLFQQVAAWGPAEDRTDPVKAATMFFTGGQAGQQGLMDIAGWEQLSVPAAAQAVEKSQFADGSNYARNLDLAQVITTAILGGTPTAAPTCTVTPVGNVTVNGVTVTIPDSPHVTEALRGKAITAPTAGVAKGLAAGFGALGLPYVWGGGGDGAPANDGCSRGGGQLNSCQGLTGYDCSGLTAYVLVSGGYPSPGGNSGGQRAGGTPVAWDQGQAGDIVGFEGHVAVYLGVIDGTRYILEASEVGVPVHVVPLTRTDHDPQLHRYWS
jgi:cell wall-associated NlpC family hydrolase